MARLKLQHGSKRPIPPRQKKARERLQTRPVQEAIFLPSQEHLVKMIAMQGADDDEIADMLNVNRELFQKWRRTYPSFAKALSEGRLSVDAAVTYKLFQNTQGFEYEEETATPKGGIVRIKRYARPETAAQKYWLENRRGDLWKSTNTTRIAGGGKGEDPVGVKVETRNELIASIIGLIASKPDGNTKPVVSTSEQIKR